MCEILAPVKSKNNLIIAINAGADAVYLGLKDFSARKTADNFTFDDLKFAVSYAKCFGVKVYVAVNTLVKETELNAFIETVNTAYSYGVDAFILQDVFLGKFLKEKMPNITLHLSTQAGVCNKYGAILAKNCGFSRVILARETKIEDIKEISSIIETEAFIQGALCTCLSGHCYFSSFVGGNSGNRGYCKQPCRKEYSYENNGKTVKKGYVLSLSDLSIGENIQILKDLGVKSFKIEGRLRSEEYLASSVRFYKELMRGNYNQTLFDYMKISFNRGDYTKGLAFNQKNDFISDKIQNNKGLFVGKIAKISKDVIVLDKNYGFISGDSFKIISNGYEVGSAVCANENHKTQIKYKGNISIGDSVHLTKKVDLLSLINLPNRKKEIEVKVLVEAGKPLSFSALGKTVESSAICDEAKTQGLTKEDIISNLNKTDIYPFKVNVVFDKFCDNVFAPKSFINNLRSELYKQIFYEINSKIPYNIEKYSFYSNGSCDKIKGESAVIISTFKGDTASFSNVIYAPYDYNNIESFKPTNQKIWLYIPPFVSGEDLKILDKIAPKFYGVYCDGNWAVEYAKEKGYKLFCGVGFNVFNSINLTCLDNENIERISLSKELSNSEIKAFNNNSLFVLSGGNIEIMDLIYCPFGKNCKNCTINNEFTLKDKENRKFVVKKYKISECRFKVYNMAKILASVNNNKIVDLSVSLPNLTTAGNFNKGVR